MQKWSRLTFNSSRTLAFICAFIWIASSSILWATFAVLTLRYYIIHSFCIDTKSNWILLNVVKRFIIIFSNYFQLDRDRRMFFFLQTRYGRMPSKLIPCERLMIKFAYVAFELLDHLMEALLDFKNFRIRATIIINVIYFLLIRWWLWKNEICRIGRAYSPDSWILVLIRLVGACSIM